MSKESKKGIGWGISRVLFPPLLIKDVIDSKQENKEEIETLIVEEQNYKINFSDRIPDEAYKRKMIILLDKEDCSIDKNVNQQFLEDDSVCKLKYPLLVEQKEGEIYKYLQNNGLLRPEKIIIQDPYDYNKYSLLPVEDENDKFNKWIIDNAIKKQTLCAEFCQLLGAKRVVRKQLTHEGVKTEVDVKTGVEVKVVDINADVKAGCKSSETKQFEGEWKFSEDAKSDFEKAELFLIKNNLQNDYGLLSLLKMRQNKDNQLKQQVVTISYTGESENYMDYISSARIFFIKIKANAKLQNTKSESINMSFEVEF